MELHFLGFTTPSPLPDVEPGALPLLQMLTVDLVKPLQPLRLPDSWGQPGLLPQLRSLKILAPVALPLPTSWARGFSQLVDLILAAPKPNSTAAADRQPAGTLPGAMAPAAAAEGAPPANEAARQLPDEWARGFPKLNSLMVSYQGLSGRFPAAWQAEGSFPLLRDL